MADISTGDTIWGGFNTAKNPTANKSNFYRARGLAPFAGFAAADAALLQRRFQIISRIRRPIFINIV